MSIAAASPPSTRDTRQRLTLVAPDVLRDVIEILQLGGDSTPLVVLEVPGASAATADRIAAALAEFAPHDIVVGWLGPNRLGIVLPHATVQEAKSLVESGGGLIKSPFSIWTSETDRAADVRPLAALYVRRMPIWKRSLDLVGASLGLICAAPLMLLAVVAIRLTTGGPALFKQQRIGLGGVHFAMYKLRTMAENAEELRDELIAHNEQTGLAFKIKDDPRVTHVGSWLRRFSIDELPQLLNVLKGDMSLVGPRPLPAIDWEPTVSWYVRRHDVKPGLTCIWQVSGRSQVNFEKWVQMDLEYIERQSIWTDLQLLLHTLPAVLTQAGAS